MTASSARWTGREPDAEMSRWQFDTLHQARRLARRRGHAQVTMEHIALVVAEADPAVGRQWRALGVDVERARRELAQAGFPESARYGRDFQFHVDASDDIVIDDAVAEFFRDCAQLPTDGTGRPAGAELASTVLTHLTEPLPGSSLLSADGRGGPVAERRQGGPPPPAPTPLPRGSADKSPALEAFGRDLTQLAALGRIDPVVGREEEIDAVLRVLRRRSKRNPLLVGEPGVGKTAIVEGVAQRIAAGALTDARLISLDLAGLLAGTRYRGEFEERVQEVLADALHATTPTILFIDEFHLVARTGAAEGGLDLGSILLAPMARGQISVVGATTPDDYHRHLRHAGPLVRRVQVIEVREPTAEEALGVVRGVSAQYEAFHNVLIDDSAQRAAVRLARGLAGHLPDTALDLVDDACAQARLHATASEPVRVLAAHVETIARSRPATGSRLARLRKRVSRARR